MTLEQIQARLAEIAGLIDTATGDDLTKLEDEARTLNEQLNTLRGEAQRRQALRDSVARGASGTAIPGATAEPRTPAAERFAVDSDEYRSAWLRNLQGRELTDQERTAVTASAAIPTQTMNEIVHRLEDSPLLREIDMTFIPGNVSWPVETTANAASWVAMGTAATDSADALTAVTLSAYKLIKTVEITADVEGMSIDAFEAWLVSRLANKIELAADAAVLTGTGSSQPTGILTTISTATGTFTKAGMTYTDLMTIMGSLGTVYRRNAIFIVPSALFYSDIIGMKGTDNRPVLVMDPTAPEVYRLLGHKVIIDDNVTANNVLFGDAKMYKWNWAKSPTVEADDSVGFRTGSRVYRAMGLADGKLAVSAAFVRYTRAA